MGSAISIMGRCSDGTFVSLEDAATTNTLTTISTGPADLNIPQDQPFGKIYDGKVLTHAIAVAQTTDSDGGAFLYAYIEDASGQIVSIIQGGGNNVSGMPQLCRPLKVKFGMLAKAKFQDAADSAGLTASLAVSCKSGKCDVFFVTAVDDTPTAMVNKDGASIGQALVGQTIMKAYASYPGTRGVNDGVTGVSGYYIESSTGSLKAMYPPAGGDAGSGSHVTPFAEYPVMIEQNDTLTVTTSV